MSLSIRWRLVLSFVLVTLLTVSATGVLALSFFRRYVAQQETENLTANAEAVAQQALPLVSPELRLTDLEALVQTSAFLAGARVRVLDEERRVLADSGLRLGQRSAWFVSPQLWRTESAGDGSPSFVFASISDPAARVAFMTDDHLSDVFGDVPSESELTFVRTIDGAWGNRIAFLEPGERYEAEIVTAALGQAQFRSQRTIVVPLEQATDPDGYVEVSGGRDYGLEALDTAERAFLLAGGGAMVVAVVCGLLVSRGLAAPVRELTGVAAQMSGGDLSIRATARGKDEIGQLAQQFNRMAGQLEASFGEVEAERDALRRFIADASHELRTPITALKSFNDLMRGAAANDTQAQAEFLAESQIQIGRLEWITSNLLDLSRLDAGLASLDMGEHDAGEVLEAAAAAFETQAAERGITLSILQPLEPIVLTCDRVRMEMALCNLLDNSIKYVAAGGEVELGAEKEGKLVRLWVRDTGPGIDPDDQPYIFERFYRGRDGQVEGTGLGLAIVRGIVEAHDGRACVESQLDVGSRFVIELPQ